MSTEHFLPNKHNLILTAIFTVVFFALSTLITPLISLLATGTPSLEPSVEVMNSPLFAIINLFSTTVVLYLLASLSLWYHEEQSATE